MAATKRNAMLIEEARGKIQTTQLINRLQNHALGTIEMSPTQVRAVEILLKKKLPDLVSAENKTEVTHNYVARIPALSKDMDSWQQTYGHTLKGPTVQ